MEKTLANISKQDKKDLKRLEKIEKAGFIKQNAYLISQGYEKLSKNLKALRKSKGDQEEALKLLVLKQKKQNEKLDSIIEKTKTLNFEPQMDYLISKGFKNIKKNFKLLTLFNGDQEKALIKLSKSKNKPNIEEEIKGLGYEKENAALVAKGFSNLKKNLKLLQLYDGKVDRVFNHYNHNKELKYDQLLKLIEEKGFEKQNTQLIEKGFTKIKRNLKNLMKCNGDLIKVFEQYHFKKEEKFHDARILCKTHGVQSQFEALLLKGIKPKKILKLMKIYEWNGEKTVKHFEVGREQHQLYFAEQIKALGFEEQNKVLIAKGFNHLKKTLKLLQLYEGNLEKVLEGYNKKQKGWDKVMKKLAKMDYMKQYQEILAKDGALKPKQILKALTKHDGDVKKAFGDFEKKKLNKEFSVKKWTNQVHVLYLDGNNILFANENIRKLYLMKKKKEAEELLEKIAKSFSLKKHLEKTVLMFDRGNEEVKIEEFTLENEKKLKFEVRCAKGQKSSDDELVALTEKEEHVKNAIVVTADLELRRRLVEKGVKLFMGAGDWFIVAKEELGPDYDKPEKA